MTPGSSDGRDVPSSRAQGDVLPPHGAGAALLAAALIGLVALPALLALHVRGLVLGPPVLLTALLVLNGVLPSEPVQRFLGGGCLRNRAVLRVALGLTLFAATAWTAGWAPLVPLAGMVLAVVHVERSGSRVTAPAIGLIAAVTSLGQLLEQAGVLTSVPQLEVSHAVALAGLVLGALTVAIVGLSVADRERFELTLARTEARVRALLDSSNDVLVVTDRDGVLTYVSPAAERTMGRTPDELVGRHLLEMVDSEHRHQVQQRLEHVVARGGGARAALDVLVVHASHERRWYEWNVRNLLDDPLVEGLVVDQRDVTDRRLHSEALAHAAAHDDLTGLANRRELMRRLSATLPQAAPGSAVAVLFCDLDHFKEVNDTLGHAAGDDLLVVVARRLRASLRPHDHLARLGGDEFCAVLSEVRDEHEVRAVVARLEEDLGRPVALGGRRVAVRASIGVALTTDPATDPERLFAHADAAMYRLKYSRRAAATDRLG
ncbi:diguanylate cyclase [Cellulomonas sp. APG4]|uniref:sensor domain-containing diguanylate cyclase n=1 Tax=Cellulomonas sp. APG4 TaxID=1538656 RepID=UPI001379A54D|nr:sensor domain-containing diguanylate cyclase [Cellulomonas sp. APG4]NCT92112.1 diguanylate cyclase [Cellulomonas sp. APG4]